MEIAMECGGSQNCCYFHNNDDIYFGRFFGAWVLGHVSDVISLGRDSALLLKNLVNNLLDHIKFSEWHGCVSEWVLHWNKPSDPNGNYDGVIQASCQSLKSVCSTEIKLGCHSKHLLSPSHGISTRKISSSKFREIQISSLCHALSTGIACSYF